MNNQFKDIINAFQNILENPDNFDLLQKVNDRDKMLTKLTELENNITKNNEINDIFSVQELSEIINTEITKIILELERAK